MDDFKVMARLLAAIKASEEKREFSPDMVSTKVLKTTEEKRDGLAIKLQKDGYIEGLFVIDDIDNMPYPVVMWGSSNPTITIKGLEFMQSSKPLRKAGAELKSVCEDAAATAIRAAINEIF